LPPQSNISPRIKNRKRDSFDVLTSFVANPK
jgi:hypothetical protein